MEFPDIPLVEEESDRFQTVVAVLIAMVTIVGALIAWRAAVAADNAGDSDFAGLAANLNVAETRILNTATLYENYRAYTHYARFLELQSRLEEDLDSATGETYLALERHWLEASDQVSTSQNFFPTRYLTTDGRYNISRALGEATAEAGQKRDLNPQPHFAQADSYRLKANRLIAIFIILALSLLFYALAEGIHPARQRLRYTLASVGTLFLVATVVAAIAVELTR